MLICHVSWMDVTQRLVDPHESLDLQSLFFVRKGGGHRCTDPHKKMQRTDVLILMKPWSLHVC